MQPVPPTPTPCKALLVLSSERWQHFMDRANQNGVTAQTAGVSTARLYGNIAIEMTLEGTHLEVVQQCASGNNAEFATAMLHFLDDSGESAVRPVYVLHTAASADVPLTSIARDGAPALHTRLKRPMFFVLSSPRSGSSLLQLCLQVHPLLYAGQELHMLQFATLDERRAICPYGFLEGLIKTVSELRQCDIGDAGEWVAAAEEVAMPTWQGFDHLQRMAGDLILVDKTPPYLDHPHYMAHAHAIFGSAARYAHLVRHPVACIKSGVELISKTLRNDAFNLERGGDPSLAWPFVERAWVSNTSETDVAFSHPLNCT